jgi:hypothetical protein
MIAHKILAASTRRKGVKKLPIVGTHGSEVRWLSRGKFFKHLRFTKEVHVFMNVKGKPLLEFSDED